MHVVSRARAALFLSLSLMLAASPAHAGVWESLARGSHRVFNSQCTPTAAQGQTPGAAPAAGAPRTEDCDPRVDPVRALQQDARHLNQDVFLAALAEERRLQDQCAVDFARELSGGPRFEQFASDLQDKVQILTENMAAALRLDQQLSQIGQRRRMGARGHREGDEAEMERLRAQMRRHMAAIAAIENSIPLGSHQEISRFVNQQMQAVGRDAFTIGGLSREGAPRLQPIDAARFRAELRAALGRAQTGMERDQRVLQEGVRSGGSGLDRATRESLAQDRDLMESFFARHPALRNTTQAVACQVDASYGRGAEARDQALLVGSIAATVGSLGVGALVRGGAAAVSLSTPARLAAARGVLTVRSARVLSSAAIGLDTVTGLQQIDTACFQNQRSTRVSAAGPVTANRCDSYRVEALSQENCALAVGLTALGVGLSSEAGQRLAARALPGGRTPATAAAADQPRPPPAARVGDPPSPPPASPGSEVVPAAPAAPPTRVASGIAEADRPRVERAREVLGGREFTPAQEAAIVRAHNVGVGQPGRDGSPARVGNYTRAQIDEKTDILRRAGFEVEDRRRLIESGTVGVAGGRPPGVQTDFVSYVNPQGQRVGGRIVGQDPWGGQILERVVDGRVVRENVPPNLAGSMRDSATARMMMERTGQPEVDRFREAFTRTDISGDAAFISFQVEGRGTRFGARVVRQDQGQVVVRFEDGSERVLSASELLTARLSATARRELGDAPPTVVGRTDPPPVARPAEPAPLRAPPEEPPPPPSVPRPPSVAVQAAPPQGPEQFVSYVSPSGERVPARVVELRSDGGRVVESFEDGRAVRRVLSPVEARTARTSVNARVVHERVADANVNRFRDALRDARLMSGDNRYISMEVGGNGMRLPAVVIDQSDTAVRVRIRDPQGSLSERVLTPEELLTARYSSSSRTVFQDLPGADPQRELARLQPGVAAPLRSAPVPQPPVGPRPGGVGEVAAPSGRGPASLPPRADAPATPLRLPNRDEALRVYRDEIDRLAPLMGSSQPEPRMAYASNGYWRQWYGGNLSELPDQGWKFHVGAKPESALEIARTLVPELVRRGIEHKVVDNLAQFAAQNGSQAGKFITIYPPNDAQARVIAELVSDILRRRGLRSSDFVQPPGEAVLGHGVFGRYGRFTGGNLTDPRTGREIPNSRDKILLPDGRLVPDVRGVTRPDGIPPL
jgi:hypothetical protein